MENHQRDRYETMEGHITWRVMMTPSCWWRRISQQEGARVNSRWLRRNGSTTLVPLVTWGLEPWSKQKSAKKKKKKRKEKSTGQVSPSYFWPNGMSRTEVEGQAEVIPAAVEVALLHAQSHEEGLAAAEDARWRRFAHQLVTVGSVLASVVPRVHLHRVHFQDVWWNCNTNQFGIHHFIFFFLFCPFTLPSVRPSSAARSARRRRSRSSA